MKWAIEVHFAARLVLAVQKAEMFHFLMIGYHSMIKFFSVDFLYFFVNPIFARLWNIDLLPPILEKRATS